MSYSEYDEINRSLRFITERLLGAGYRRRIQNSVKEELPDKKDDIAIVCSRIAIELGSKSTALDKFDKKIQAKNRRKKKYKDRLLTKKEAIEYSGFPKSTFERKVNDAKIKKIVNGKPRFSISDLDTLSFQTLAASEKVFCIDTLYHYDDEINAYIKFAGGKLYEIIDKDSEFIYVYNTDHLSTAGIPKSTFSRNFIRKDHVLFGPPQDEIRK